MGVIFYSMASVKGISMEGGKHGSVLFVCDIYNTTKLTVHCV